MCADGRHKRCYLNVFVGCNLTEVQGIGVGLRVAGKLEYSAHGIIVGENVNHARRTVKIAVRSRPWVDEP